MISIAPMLMASVTGLAPFDTYASMAWVSASMPVVAAILPGSPATIRRSSTAIFTNIRSETMTIFTWVAGLVITAPLVTSLPLPTVVGIAMTGSGSGGELVDAFVVGDAAAARGQDRHRFGDVHARPAADGDEDVGPGIDARLVRGVDSGDIRISHDGGEDGDVQARRFQDA